jgi:hypothetical protein
LNYLGFTDPVNVKFANTPNAVKSMIGLPLAPSYLAGIPIPQQAVLTTVPPIRQQLNRYRYAAQFIFFLEAISHFIILFLFFCYIYFFHYYSH